MKKYAIEFKLKKTIFSAEFLAWFNDWQIWRKYKTEKSRDTAFNDIVAKNDIYDYRKKDL